LAAPRCAVSWQLRPHRNSSPLLYLY
jgi:hypothetical protein